MTLIDKAEAHDDDLIRRGDALKAAWECLTGFGAWEAIRAIPARGVGVKPLVFRDETGDGVLTSRETGELFRIFPQHDGVFFAPKLPEGENTAPDAQTLIDRYNARWSARILAALAPTDAAQAREAALHPDDMLPEAIRLIRQEASRDHSQEVVTGLKHIALLLEQLIKEDRT